ETTDEAVAGAERGCEHRQVVRELLLERESPPSQLLLVRGPNNQRRRQGKEREHRRDESEQREHDACGQGAGRQGNGTNRKLGDLELVLEALPRGRQLESALGSGKDAPDQALAERCFGGAGARTGDR